MSTMRALVIGVGNPWRADDAVGLEVARRLRRTLADGIEVLEREGEPTALIEAWQSAEAVWLVDAVRSGAPPGTVHRLDASKQELPGDLFRTSTHHLGLAEAVELARALGRLPERVVVYGIEGADFDAGGGLTNEVDAAAERVSAAVRKEVAECMSST
jgi:hydrogenase maturation protease